MEKSDGPEPAAYSIRVEIESTFAFRLMRSKGALGPFIVCPASEGWVGDEEPSRRKSGEARTRFKHR